jgi:regulator of RNase E activity RraA
VANQFTGTATQANTLLWNGSYRTAASTSTANTVVIRDASSNIYCNVLNGTATSAQYADLAEKYLADQEYDVGTVVVVGGDKEVTASTWGKRAIGVVSANPAFMMNRDLEGGTYIALKGRVPVKVIGSVKKGDNLIAANDGCASVAVHHSSEVFAVALESNSDTSMKLVEAVIL